jgi:hypothetical protein
MMIRQAWIGVKVEETDAAVTGLGGVPGLVNLAHGMGLFKDVDALLPPRNGIGVIHRARRCST